ncbi:uncharacterized protein LOC129005278 [Macrosteles quadrilineatus]|uniref:uncharacterized protein LOC129005278 n=1 Tax=Macrosteles quadrilineatus TaxID=74068 RepID=UPI0023E11614|nr:uncharacterized protein LOC129005278 [Macrosteles quadrilineatus]
MSSFWLYFVSFLLTILLQPVQSSPVKFEDSKQLQRQDLQRSLSSQEEGRVFHAHAIKKRKKKKLLQCLLSLQRNNPKPQGDARFLLINYMNLEYNLQGGNRPYSDDSGSSNCLSQFTGSNNDNGGGGGSALDGIGEGINNLGSLVGQVPSDIISTVGDGIKPVFENPERYINRYFIRPLYRSLRPLYRWF